MGQSVGEVIFGTDFENESCTGNGRRKSMHPLFILNPDHMYACRGIYNARFDWRVNGKSNAYISKG